MLPISQPKRPLRTGAPSPGTQGAAIVYHLPTVSRFFHTVARAVAVQRTTSVEWQSYDDNTVINVIYGVMFWKEKPGVQEVHQGTPKEVRQLTSQLHGEFLQAWIKHLTTKGPERAQEYAATMAKLRDQANQAVLELFRNNAQVNAEVVHELTVGIQRLAAIKLAGTVGVAVIGAAAGLAAAGVLYLSVGTTAAGASVLTLGATPVMAMGSGALGFAGVGLANSVALSTIDNWDNGKKASAVGVEFGKAGTSEALGHVTAGASGILAEELADAARVERNAQISLERASQMLTRRSATQGGKVSEKLIRKEAEAGAKAATAQQTLKSASRWATGAKVAQGSVPLVFAALDIWGAIESYNKTMDGLK